MYKRQEEALYAQMERSLEVMRESVEEGLDPDKRSASGLTGGDAYKMMRAVQENRNICGKIFGDAMTKALAVSQTNACKMCIRDRGETVNVKENSERNFTNFHG